MSVSFDAHVIIASSFLAVVISFFNTRLTPLSQNLKHIREPIRLFMWRRDLSQLFLNCLHEVFVARKIPVTFGDPRLTGVYLGYLILCNTQKILMSLLLVSVFNVIITLLGCCVVSEILIVIALCCFLLACIISVILHEFLPGRIAPLFQLAINDFIEKEEVSSLKDKILDVLAKNSPPHDESSILKSIERKLEIQFEQVIDLLSKK